MSGTCLPVKKLTEEEKKEIDKAHDRFFKCLMMKQDEIDDYVCTFSFISRI